MGLGGAFVALADDATAAFANPAGLVQLVRPEVSIELRRRDYSTPFTSGGRAIGAPTGIGIDTVDGVTRSDSNETASGVSFLSFVFPGKRWSLAVYRHQLADFVFRTELDGLFGDAPEGGNRRYEDQRAATELDFVGTGLSGAFKVSERLSLGLGVTCFSVRMESRVSVYGIERYPDTFFEPNPFLPERLSVSSNFTGNESDWGFNLGVLWKATDMWRFGGVYRQGPRVPYELVNRAGPFNELPEGTVLEAVTDRSIGFPDVWGLGVAYRSPNGSLTVGFEWDRVEYSIIRETLDSPLVDASQAALDDASELHLGVEYVFLATTPLVAIRGGLWRDPDHSFRYIGDDPFARALYQGGEAVLHLTAGAGVAFGRFQIDLGADLSDTSDTVALSAIYSF
jgi:long-chain fatty acid transport protein